MTLEQEELLYQTVFFVWPEGHRDFESQMTRVREMVTSETRCELHEARIKFATELLNNGVKTP